MKFLIINGKIQTLNGKPIIVPDDYDDNLIKIGGKFVKTVTNLIGSKHSGDSGGGGTVTAGAIFNDDTNGNADGIDGDVFLSWDELKDSANGELYAYQHFQISDTEIGDGTFSGCMDLKSITLPNSINSIGSMAFDSCFNLISANLGSVTDIVPDAFGYCINLTSVTLPNSLVFPFNPGCFYSCENLTEMNFTGTKAEWNAVVVDTNWWNEMGTNVHTIHCTDGDITKS